ncbi:hypothetical protein ACJX0J_041457, partial [Zea mays]
NFFVEALNVARDRGADTVGSEPAYILEIQVDWLMRHGTKICVVGQTNSYHLLASLFEFIGANFRR